MITIDNLQVTVPHVEEAYRLLNKSIIRVEQPDINLDGEEDEPGAVHEEDEEAQAMDDMRAEEAEMMETESRGDSHSIADSRPESLSQKKKLKMSYIDYKNMSNLILIYMRREEGKSEDDGEETEGLKRSRIVDWYLNEIGDTIDTEEELIEKKELVEKVIKRLIEHVSNLVALMTYKL